MYMRGSTLPGQPSLKGPMETPCWESKASLRSRTSRCSRREGPFLMGFFQGDFHPAQDVIPKRGIAYNIVKGILHNIFQEM